MQTPSVGAELSRLARLAEIGLITTDELEAQKDALLQAVGAGQAQADHFVGEELERLATLFQRRVLSREEFDTQKALLLAAGTATGQRISDMPPPGPAVRPVRPSLKEMYLRGTMGATNPHAIPDGWEWMLIIAGGMAAIGSLLPWEQVSVLGVGVSRNGFQLGNHLSFSIDGLATMALGIVAALIGISRLTARPFPQWLNRSPIILGAALLYITVNDVVALTHTVHNLQARYPSASVSVGYGVWLALVGGAIIAFGGIAGFLGRWRQQAPEREPGGTSNYL